MNIRNLFLALSLLVVASGNVIADDAVNNDCSSSCTLPVAPEAPEAKSSEVTGEASKEEAPQMTEEEFKKLLEELAKAAQDEQAAKQQDEQKDQA